MSKSKGTVDFHRERALEILRLYEAGATPKELAAKYDQETDWIWKRIKFARSLREKMGEVA